MSLEGAEKGSDFLIKVSGSDGRMVHTEKLNVSELTIDISEIGPDGDILAVRKIVLNQKK